MKPTDPLAWSRNDCVLDGGRELRRRLWPVVAPLSDVADREMVDGEMRHKHIRVDHLKVDNHLNFFVYRVFRRRRL